MWGSLELTLNYSNKPIQRWALTHYKLSFVWNFFFIFSLIAHKAAPATSITLLHMLYHQCAGVSSTVVAVIVHITAILQPLKLEVISCGFNLEDCLCSSKYRLACGVLGHPWGINWHRRGKRDDEHWLKNMYIKFRIKILKGKLSECMLRYTCIIICKNTSMLWVKCNRKMCTWPTWAKLYCLLWLSSLACLSCIVLTTKFQESRGKKPTQLFSGISDNTLSYWQTLRCASHVLYMAHANYTTWFIVNIPHLTRRFQYGAHLFGPGNEAVPTPGIKLLFANKNGKVVLNEKTIDVSCLLIRY